MKIQNEFIISGKNGPLKSMFKLHFQIWTLPDIKLIFGDINFEAPVMIFILWAVKNSLNLYMNFAFAKIHFHPELTYFKYACDVSFFLSVYM